MLSFFLVKSEFLFYNNCIVIFSFDIAAFVVGVILLFFYYNKRTISTFQNKLFLIYVIVVLISVPLEVIAYISNNSQLNFPFIAVCFFQGLHFSSEKSFGVIYILYCAGVLDLLGRKNDSKEKLRTFLATIPYFLALVLIWLSLVFIKSGTFAFYITPEGSVGYTKNIWFYFLYFVNVLYILISFIMLIRYRAKAYFQSTLLIIFSVLLTACSVAIQVLTGTLVELFGLIIVALFFYHFIQRPEDVLDSVTGVFNQIGFVKVTGTLFSKSQRFACVSVIIDDMTFMSNTFGIRQMNIFLAQVATFFKQTFSYNNIFYFSNGCFFILIRDPNSEKIQQAIQNIQDRFKENWYYDSVELKLYVRLCVFDCPRDAENSEEILDIVNLIEIDDRYKQNLVFASEIDIEYKRRTDYIEHALRKGITYNRFDIYYQPIYSTAEKKLIGAEALIRLKDEKGRFISPEDFIPIAEKSGTILRIGEFVFESVCRTLSTINLEEYGIKKIDINLSVAQCMQEILSEQILAIRNIYQVPTSIINLEITETAAAHTPEILMKNMQQLSDAGFELSLDDYGSGYSNMGYMLNLPFKMIKIDKYIVWSAFSDERANKALSATIKMIKSIGMTVLAEGVEEKEQVEWLTQMGCDYLQGYYFAKPLEKDLYLELMKKNMETNGQICRISMMEK